MIKVLLYTFLFLLYIWWTAIRPDYIWHEQVFPEATQEGWTLIYSENAPKRLFGPWTWIWPPIDTLCFADLSRIWISQNNGRNIGLLPILQSNYYLHENEIQESQYVLLVDLDNHTFSMWSAEEVYSMADSEEIPNFEKEEWYPHFNTPDFEAAIWSIFEDWRIRMKSTPTIEN